MNTSEPPSKPPIDVLGCLGCGPIVFLAGIFAGAVFVPFVFGIMGLLGQADDDLVAIGVLVFAGLCVLVFWISELVGSERLDGIVFIAVGFGFCVAGLFFLPLLIVGAVGIWVGVKELCG